MLCRVGGGHPPRPSPAPFGPQRARAPRRRRAGRRTLVRDALFVEPHGQAPARETPLGSERDAAVGDSVPDVDERAEAGDSAALAPLAADIADGPVAERRAPAGGSAVTLFATTRASTPSRARIGSISSWKPADTISGSCASTSSWKPRRTRTSSSSNSTTSSSGAVTVAISRAITSSSVSRRPSSSSSARTALDRRTARSPCGACRPP